MTSIAEMEVKAPPAKHLDKIIWDPEIDLAPRAVSGESNSFHFILGHQKLKIFYLAGPQNHPRGQHESESMSMALIQGGPLVNGHRTWDLRRRTGTEITQ